MKQLIVVTVAGLATVAVLFAGCPRGPADAGRPVTDFVSCEGDRFDIDLLDAMRALPESTPDAHLDQLRDWVWSTLLARLAARSAQPELLLGLVQQPVERDDAWSDWLEQPVGRTRSTIGRDGTVYVLVQRSPAQRSASRQTLEDVLEAVDREELSLGEQARAVEVYGVDLQTDRAQAQVCRLGSRSAAWLRAPEQGFRHRQVASASDLAAFLASGTDLLTASSRLDGHGRPVLDVTGRLRSRTAHAPITVEDVATLDGDVRFVPLDRLATARNLPEEIRADSRRLAAQIDAAQRQAAVAGASLRLSSPDRATTRLLDHVLAWQRQRPDVATEELILSYRAQDPSDLGFSLDPKTDVAATLRRLDELIAALPSGTQLLRVLADWDMPAQEALSLAVWSANGGSLAALRLPLATLRAAVRAGDPRGAERLLLEAENRDGGTPLAVLVRQAVEGARYQSARYDGPLAGTAAAMTLFYTDLVAKLWALDWQRGSPSGVLPGFVSVALHRDSTLFCRDDSGVPNTRIWFGVRPEGYVRDSPVGLRLAPVVTRLYARGSALGAGLSPEVEPAAPMQRFIRWWDRHYAEIAGWEPQYERLNQLIKWTLVRRMAEAAGADRLSFLASAEPERDRRFDHWLAAQDDLRWPGPIHLLERSGETTETLPLFSSESYRGCGGVHRLSGGVSLPSPSELDGRPIRLADPRPPFRRLDPLHPSARLAEGGSRVASRRLAGGEIGESTVTVMPDGVTADRAMVLKVRIKGDNYALLPGQGTIAFHMRAIWSEGGQRARWELEGRFGMERLQIDGLQGPSPRLQLQPDSFHQALRLAGSVSSRLQSGAQGLRLATRWAAGELDVWGFPDSDTVAVGLPATAGEGRTVAILSSAGGIRGPPAIVQFEVAAIEPKVVPGSGEAGRSSVAAIEHAVGRGWAEPGRISVALVKEADARPYLLAHHGERILDGDAVVQAVRDRLRAGDLPGARAAVTSPQATARAIAQLASAATRHDRPALLGEMVARLERFPAAGEEIRHLVSQLTYRIAELNREGTAASAALRQQLLDHQIRLARVVAPLTAREAGRAQAAGEERLPGAFYAPAGDPAQLALAPFSHPPGESAPAGQRYARELIDLPARLSDLPARLWLGDQELHLVRTAGAAAQAPGPISFLPHPAEPLRLLAAAAARAGAAGSADGLVWPLILVVPCAERGPGAQPRAGEAPSCSRAGGDEESDPALQQQAWKAAAALLACDLNGDGRIGGEQEKLCVDAVVRAHAPAFEPISP